MNGRPLPWSHVVIESPYKAGGDTQRLALHLLYLDFCILDALGRRETPYASHKMLTTALNDDNPEERDLGIEAGLAMLELPGMRHAFYLDLNWSGGMRKAWRHCRGNAELRQIKAEAWVRFCQIGFDRGLLRIAQIPRPNIGLMPGHGWDGGEG